MTPSTTHGAIWNGATDADALALAKTFESAWKSSQPGMRPDPDQFLRVDSRRRPGDLLAILRVDIAHRHGSGEDARPELYRDRYPGLHPDVFVALIYEDFCLREEAGESPDPLDYETRFPEVADRLRELLEIHDLVAEPGSTAPGFDPNPIAFPEAGATIAGFRLVEELGRGSFARVFLAQERQLADRPVALKVSRAGSREPQTLARLQHTHIVPVHSYLTDPATGLHLLCMPYFGRITLARLLGDPALREPGSGLELVRTLDRIGASEATGESRPAAHSELSRRTFPRAIAWWGARMAEALQHAHDRGVLHRDVKPSNVLISGDGMPMLLDFNLSRESEIETVAPSKVGGTLAYMAPEHLEALVEGDDAGIDHRADIYSLGMVLLEALGSKPLETPSQATTLAESLTRLIDHRRRESPRLVVRSGPVPPGLEAVIRLCLAPSRDDRYASAGDLAVDLQAIADDAPLPFAREPWSPRVMRWLRRNRTGIAILAPLAVATLALLAALFQNQAEQLRREGQARVLIRDGIRSADLEEFQAASAQFARASAMIEDRPDLAELRDEALRRRELAGASQAARDRANVFFDRAEPLRFALLGFGGDKAEATRSLIESLRPLGVLESVDWREKADLGRLDEPRRARLLREVDDLLFFWVIAAAMEGDESSRLKMAPVALTYCDLALRFTDRERPWQVLRDFWRDGASARPALPGDPAREGSAPACFRWSLLARLARDEPRVIAWLERATRLEPEDYWHQYALAYEYFRAGRMDRAMPPIDAAVALRSGSPSAREFRSKLLANLGRWQDALDDLGEALASCSTATSRAKVRFERGWIRQKLGDFVDARADYEAAIEAEPSGPIGRDAGRNLARLEADSGRNLAGLARYDRLIASDPADTLSIEGRIRLNLRIGRPDRAEADLTLLLDRASGAARASLLADRALARLLRNLPLEAEADAREAQAIQPSAADARLLGRAQLASGRGLATWPDRPDAFEGWPDGGESLQRDLRAAAGRLEPADRRNRAVLLSAASRHREALDEADRLVDQEPTSVPNRLLRARINFRGGWSGAALADVAKGLRDSPEDPDWTELRGMIRVDAGDFAGGLVDLTVARDRGLASAVGPWMARALMGLGRPASAAEVWTMLVEDDPLDAPAYLELATARRRQGDWDQALVALEDASAVLPDGSPLLGKVTLGYLAWLPAKPDRLPRVLSLLKRMTTGRPR